MVNKIQIKRGKKASLPTLSEGEMALCTDTNEVFIGNTSNVQLTTKNDIVNNLTTGGATSVLSAEQGKILKELIDKFSSVSLDTLMAKIERIERNVPTYAMENIFSYDELCVEKGCYKDHVGMITYTPNTHMSGRTVNQTETVVEENCVYQIFKIDIPNAILYVHELTEDLSYNGSYVISGNYVTEYRYGSAYRLDYSISGSQAQFRTKQNTKYLELSVFINDPVDSITGKYCNYVQLILSSVKIIKVA